MLELAFAVGLGIVIAVLVLENLPKIFEGIRWILGILLLIVIAWLIIPTIDSWYSALGVNGPWFLLVLVLVLWAFCALRGVQQAIQIVRSSHGDQRTAAGWIGASLVISFLIIDPLSMMEEGPDPVLAVDRPFLVRLVDLSPIFFSLVLVVIPGMFVIARRLRDLIRRNRHGVPR